jgi:hypothetical protein
MRKKRQQATYRDWREEEKPVSRGCSEEEEAGSHTIPYCTRHTVTLCEKLRWTISNHWRGVWKVEKRKCTGGDHAWDWLTQHHQMFASYVE